MSSFRPSNDNLNDSNLSNYSSNFQRPTSPPPPPPRPVINQNEIEYLEEQDLDLLNNLDNYEIFNDEASNEAYLINQSDPS